MWPLSDGVPRRGGRGQGECWGQNDTKKSCYKPGTSDQGQLEENVNNINLSKHGHIIQKHALIAQWSHPLMKQVFGAITHIVLHYTMG